MAGRRRGQVVIEVADFADGAAYAPMILEDSDTSPMEATEQRGVVEATRPRTPVNPPAAQSTPRDYHTEIYKGPIYEPPLDTNSVENTMPKQWQTAGMLGAQLTITQIQLAAGERVRVPLSLRNDYPHKLELQTLITGIDESWVTMSEPTIVLRPREVRLVDMVFFVPPPVYQERAELNLLLVDVNQSDIRMNLSLFVIFKRTPDLIGKLEPATLRDGQTAFLKLQNHTQGVARVFIAGSSPSARVRVLPQQSELHLPPGQTAQVPVKFAVDRRPLFSGAVQNFSVSAQQGTRAPLDFPGKLRVRPHMSCLTVLILLVAIGAVMGAALLRFGNPLTSPEILSVFAPNQAAEAVATQAEAATDRPSSTKESGEGRGGGSEEPTPTEETDTLSFGDLLSNDEQGDAPAETPDAAEPVTVEDVEPVATEDIELAAPERATPVPTATVAVDADPVPPTATATPVPSVPPAPPAFVDPRPLGCAAAIPAGWTPYTVQSGDNLFRLALNHNTTIDDIIAVNCMVPPSYLVTGHVILLPNQ
ncbi:MAG: LysM domain-containing protein [Anaerolineae bacterium]